MNQTISPRGQSMRQPNQSLLKQHLWLRILIGMALGILVGVVLAPSGLGIVSEALAFGLGEWLALPGVIFLGLIQMVIVPLIACSIILGIAEAASLSFLKNMGIRSVLYFIFTTVVSITIGIVIVQIVKPGAALDAAVVQEALESGTTIGVIPTERFDDLTIPKRIANMVPSNLERAGLDRNMLQIVIASILIGIAMLTISKKHAKPFQDLCTSGQVITMQIIGWAMALAPYAVFGLISNITIRLGPEAFVSVGAYMLTVLAGLGCMGLVYMFLVTVVAKQSLSEFLKGIREAQLLAFSTSSSAATMPFSIKAAEENLKMRSDVSRFVIPLGATINMDGTALYQAVAAVFLCQVFGIDLTLGQTVMLIVTTVGASIGTPGTPGVGIVVLATILGGVGVPAEGIALILSVDRILDMCRTTINVTGDLTATAVINRFAGSVDK